MGLVKTSVREDSSRVPHLTSPPIGTDLLLNGTLSSSFLKPPVDRQRRGHVERLVRVYFFPSYTRYVVSNQVSLIF